MVISGLSIISTYYFQDKFYDGSNVWALDAMQISRCVTFLIALPVNIIMFRMFYKVF